MRAYMGGYGMVIGSSRVITARGDKPHICEYCQKRFALACNLRAHLKTHEGEHQEKCAGCGKSYSTSGGRLLSRGYCPACLGTLAGNGLSSKTGHYESEPPKSPTLDSNEDSKGSSRSNPDLAVSPTTPPPRLLFGVLDQMMMRYRQSAQAFLPPSLSTMKFLEGASMLTP
ncbi:hypothetical protein V5799_034242 [Amblyomma americanum]|uniref:C2H2-type domain-containing protein n=1 Tax=Amblyomma americanum TaxID=6943 RepID=A0AAQ4DL14_AMBAM